MPTYAELQAEPWWGREVVPAPLVQLGERLRAAYGRPAAAVGVKGDNVHLRGAHRSQEWLLKSRYCTNRSYTVQSGLTEQQSRHLAGFDFNPGSEAGMIQLCSRLDRAVRAGRLEQVREWFGNDDGDQRVDGYNNVRNQIATSDASHLWHLHLTLDRRMVDDEAAMRAVGDVLLDEDTSDQEDDMLGLKLGDTGPRVRLLQAMLSDGGHPVEGGVDGIYGDATAAAVAALRRAEGSEDVDGRVVDHWAVRQIHRAQARRVAEAALADRPGLPATVTLHLPDRITVPVTAADDEG